VGGDSVYHILGGAKMASIGKKHADVLKLVDATKLYSVEEAVEKTLKYIEITLNAYRIN